ncbi:MAG: hypothetical protein EPN91_02760 [Salinibacterium sp.]|nr:MAG: hypothetical protein EPN91_02760 [Salinibacterium sp.]
MSHLNPEYVRAPQMGKRPRLRGSEHGLDALVGLVILVAEISIGLQVLQAMYEFGDAQQYSRSADQLTAGFAIALFGGGIAFVITTIIYLARMATGRRSWPAPLWGTIIMGLSFVVGFAIMAA